MCESPRGTHRIKHDYWAGGRGGREQAQAAPRLQLGSLAAVVIIMYLMCVRVRVRARLNVCACVCDRVVSCNAIVNLMANELGCRLFRPRQQASGGNMWRQQRYLHNYCRVTAAFLCWQRIHVMDAA